MTTFLPKKFTRIAQLQQFSANLLCPRGAGALSGDRRLSSVRLMSRTSALTWKPKGLGRWNFAQGYTRSHATPTPTSRSKGQKSRSRGGGILWRPPSRTACYQEYRPLIDVFIFPPHLFRALTLPSEIVETKILVKIKQIMKISQEDRILIINLYLSKRYGARRLLHEYPDWGWKLESIDSLLKRIRKMGTTVRQSRSSRPLLARSSGGPRAKSGQAKRHRSACDISCETTILCSSVHTIIHHDLQLRRRA